LLAPAGTLAPIPWTFLLRGLLCLVPLRFFVRNLLHWMAPNLANGREADRQLLTIMVEDAFLALRSFTPRPVVPPTAVRDEQLASLVPPTLVLLGENERFFDPTKALERLRRVAPHIESALLPGCGHDLFVVGAVEVNRRILEFLLRRPPHDT